VVAQLDWSTPVAHGLRTSNRIAHQLKAGEAIGAVDGRIVLAVDVSNWLWPDASTSAERLFCHTYGRGKRATQMIPGWPW
jgi:hypothetical protein